MKSVRKVLTFLSSCVLILSGMFCLFVDRETVINCGLTHHTSWSYLIFIMVLSVFICVAIFCVGLEDWRRYFYHASVFAVIVAGYWCYQDTNIFMLIVIMGIIAAALSIPILMEKKIEYIAAELEGVQLGRKRAYNQLYAYIRQALKEGGGKAVLLSGGWGSGKTHCLQYIAHKLSFPQTNTSENGVKEEDSSSNEKEKNSHTEDDFKGKVKICWLNLWECSSKVDAWNTIVQALGRTILGRAFLFNSPWIHKYLSDVIRLFPAGEVMKCLYDLVFQGDHNRNKVLCKHLSEAIDNNERVVLIFDDVERANYEIIKALPSLIDRLSEIKKLIVICAIAKDELAMVHKKELNQENPDDIAMDILVGYLIKVFDYSFQLPDISPHKRSAFINYVLNKKDPKKECTHTRLFMEESHFHYSVPRQIECVTELLLGIERQFFYHSSLCSWENTVATTTKSKKQFYNEGDGIGECIRNCLGVHGMYTYYQYVVFLIETMRLFCPEILEEAQKFSRGPVEFAKEANQMVSLSEAEEAKNEKIKNFRENYEGVYKSLKNKQLNRDLLRTMETCTLENVLQAIEGEYKRRTCITFDECESFYAKYKNKVNFDLLDALTEFYENKDEVPDDIEASGLELFEYFMGRAINDDTGYVNMLLKLIPQGSFEWDKGIKPPSNRKQAFTWSLDHFFHTLYLYTVKEILDERFKDTVIQMFDRASILTKYSILHEFFHFQKDKLPQLKDKIEDKLYYYKLISVDKVNGIIEELFKCYVKRYIQGILESKISINVILDNLYGISNFFMFLVERGNYTNILSDEFIMTNIEGISNSIEVLTLPCVCQDHSKPKIMMSSERMVDLILPILQRGFDIYGVNAVTPAQIDRWIEKCEASIEYWSKDQTELNKLRNYTVGAEEVKTFLEKIKGSQSSVQAG